MDGCIELHVRWMDGMIDDRTMGGWMDRMI